MLLQTIISLTILIQETNCLAQRFNWPFRHKRQYGLQQNRKMFDRYKNTLLDGLDSENAYDETNSRGDARDQLVKSSRGMINSEVQGGFAGMSVLGLKSIFESTNPVFR